MKTIEFFEHPDYKNNKKYWQRQLDLYEGKHEVLTNNKYLWFHEFERNSNLGGDILRQIRQQRTQYANFITPILQSYINILFNNDINFSEIEKIIPENEFQDIDGRGTNFLNFIKNRIVRDYFLYGKSITLVDSFSSTASNKLEERQRNIRPFLESWSPLSVFDWDIETADASREGRYNLVGIKYNSLAPRASLNSQPKIEEYIKVLSNVSGIYEIEIYKKDGDQFSNTPEIIPVPELTELPITILDTGSWLEEAIPQILLRHNLQSCLDNCLNYQAYQKTLISGKFDGGEALILNEASYGLLPEGCTVTTIPPVDPVALAQRVEAVTADIWRIAFFQTRVLNNNSQAVESAQTQQETKDMFLKAMRDAGSDVEEAVNNIVKDYATFKGVKDFEGRVKFDLDFSKENLNDIIQLAGMFQAQIERYPEWKKQVYKKVAQKLNLDNVDKVFEEIENEKEVIRPNLLDLINE